MVVQLILIVALVGIPILILADSKKRIARFSWEWAILGFAAMSTYAALLIDIVVPQYPSIFGGPGSDSFVKAWIRVVSAGLGPYLFFQLYRVSEGPKRVDHSKSKILRGMGAVCVLIFVGASYLPKVLAQSPWLERLGEYAYILIVTGVSLFVVGQILMIAHRRILEASSENETPKED
jgi:hypothetical protein